MKEIKSNGLIATLRLARKVHTCKGCKLPIPKDTNYYAVIFGTAGLGDHKFPDRFHVDCLKMNEGGEKDGSRKSSS